MSTLYRKAPAAEDRAASAARAAESPEEELARLRRENATLREIAELRAQNEALRAGLVEAPAHAIPAARAKVDDVDSRRVGHPRQLSARAFRQSKTLSAHAFAEFQEAETALAAKAAGPLPGGYAVGDNVFFGGDSQTFPSGNKLTHGQAGVVSGPAKLESNVGKGVAVKFPGNKEPKH